MARNRGNFVLLVIFFVAAKSVSCQNFFMLPSGNKELVYKYQAEVKSGIQSPTFANQFILDANLHISPGKDVNKVILHLKNPKIQVGNGKIPMETLNYDHSRFITLPNRTDIFFTPFVIEYNKNGYFVKEIFTPKDEPLWVLNIKKSIASILQLNRDSFKFNKGPDPFVYNGEERTIYGDCNMTFIGKPTSTGFILEKNYNPVSCNRFNSFLHSTLDFGDSQESEDQYFTMENYRTYSIEKTKSENYVIDQIVAKQKMFVFPYKHVGQSYYVITNQTFIYKNTITSAAKISDSGIDYKRPHSIVFTKPNVDGKGRYPDFTLNRSVADMIKKTEQLYKLLLQAVSLLNGEVTKETPNQEAISEIMNVLKYYEVTDFEHCIEYFREKEEPIDMQILDLFYRIVPNVGTGASALFIKDMIKFHKIKDKLATGMLATLGANIRITSIELVASLDELIHLDLKKDVKGAALLAFSNIIYKTFKHNKKGSTVAKYVDYFYDLLNKAEKHEDQLLYIHVLRNIKYGKVYKYLMPIAKGYKILKHPFDENVQMHALRALERIVGKHNPHQLYEVALHVFINKKLGNEIRVAALQIILDNMDLTQVINIFWLMQKETDYDVYQFYYKYVQSHSNLRQSNQNSAFRELAALFKKITKNREIITGASAFAFESVNVEMGQGGYLKGYMLSGKSSEWFSYNVDYIIYIMNRPIKLFNIFFKVYERETFLDIPQLIDEILIGDKKKTFSKSELVMSLGDKIILSKVFNDNLWNIIFDESTLFPLKYLAKAVFYHLQVDYTVPSDLGTMIQLFAELPEISQFKFDFDLSVPEQWATILINFKNWIRETYKVQIYNPFTDAWQGIKHAASFNMNFPLHLKVSFESDTAEYQPLPRLTIENLAADNMKINFFSYVDTKLFVTTSESEENYLKLSSKGKDLDEVKASKGPNFVRHNDLFQYDVDDLRLKYKISVFDCESQVVGEDIKSLSDLLPLSRYSKSTENSFAQFLFQFKHAMQEGLHAPQMLSCGVEGHIVTVSPTDRIKKIEAITKYLFSGMLLTIDLKNNDNTSLAQFRVSVSDDNSGYNFRVYRFGRNQSSSSICFKADDNVSVKDRQSVKLHGCYGKYHGWQEQCVEDGFSFTVEATSAHSKSQLTNKDDEYLTYSECLSNAEYLSLPYTLNSRCMDAAGSKRYIKYILDYENVPLELDIILKKLRYWIYDLAHPVQHMTSLTPLTKPNQVVVEFENLMTNEEKSALTIKLPHESFSFENSKSINLLQDVTIFGKHYYSMFPHMRYFNLKIYCKVLVNPNPEVDHSKHYPKLNEWTPYLTYNLTLFSGNDDDDILLIMLKKINDNEMALKIQAGENVVTVEPHPMSHGNLSASKYEVSMNEDQLKGHMRDIFSLTKVRDTFFFAFIYDNSVLSFDGRQALFEIYNRYKSYGGLCMEEN